MSFSLRLTLMCEDNFRIFQALLPLVEINLPSSSFLNTIDQVIFSKQLSVFVQVGARFFLWCSAVWVTLRFFFWSFFLTLWFYSSYSNLRGHRRQGYVTILIFSIRMGNKEKNHKLCVKKLTLELYFSGLMSHYADMFNHVSVLIIFMTVAL